MDTQANKQEGAAEIGGMTANEGHLPILLDLCHFALPVNRLEKCNI